MLWLVATASAGPGLALPPGENPAEWRDAAALAGLALGCDTSACVEVIRGAAGWTLVVSGGARSATVSAPRDGTARVEVAWLAASLLTPLLPPPPVAVATPPPPRPPPVPRPRAPPRPIPSVVAPPSVPVPEAPSPVAALPVATTEPAAESVPLGPPPPPAVTPTIAAPPDPVVVPAPHGRGPAGILRASVGVASAIGLGVAPTGELAVGAGATSWEVDAAAAVRLAAPLRAVEPVSSERRLDLSLGALGRPAPWVAAGGAVGFARRSWLDAGAHAGAVWTPMLAAELRLLAPTPPLDLYVALRVGADIRPIAVSVGGEPAGHLSPWWGSTSLGVVLPGRRGR
jgi:hypothetical protein